MIDYKIFYNMDELNIFFHPQRGRTIINIETRIDSSYKVWYRE